MKATPSGAEKMRVQVARSICRAWFYCDLDTPDGIAHWRANEARCLAEADAAIAALSTKQEGGECDAGASPLPSTAGWRPMASAPKEGTEIWAYTSEGEQRVVHWEEAWGPSSDDPGHDAGWASDCGSTYPGCFYRGQQPAIDQPIRWRPLPASPELEEDADVEREEQVNAASSTRCTPPPPSPPQEGASEEEGDGK